MNTLGSFGWRARAFGWILVGLFGCPPHPVPPTPDADAAVFHVDAGEPIDAQPTDVGLGPDADEADRVCAQLAALGCPEAFPKTGTCAGTVRKTQAAKLTDLHPACLIAATSKAEARACKSVTCP